MLTFRRKGNLIFKGGAIMFGRIETPMVGRFTLEHWRLSRSIVCNVMIKIAIRKLSNTITLYLAGSIQLIYGVITACLEPDPIQICK
jgi:hypothetical protein